MKLSKNYEPGQYEDDIYALWEGSEAFVPKDRGTGKTYSVVVPPPNANANIHIGTAMTLGLEDIAVRYHRMKGDKTLFLPGADHAGFETQAVYEKKLNKEGKSRFDFTREELYSQIFSFVGENRAIFEKQFRGLGASLDWSRYTYTLDDHIVNNAYKTFKKMWDEGLVYRGERLVNYCTYHGTGFADIEVAYEEATTPLYYLKYGPFELATTRPETKFGDTAVAVHPDDSRYKEYIGKNITIEGVNGPFEVMVIADEMVDREFGTGVVKITPAHSFDDWEAAQRHNLPAVRVINHDGTLNEKTGQFRGMSIEDGRKAVVAAMKEKGLIIKVDKDYKNRVGKCYKCGTIIEPMMMKQWFINMQPLTKPALEALKKDKITFYPDSKKQQLITYLEGLRDWNISRQIAWGIPIPAFQNVDDEDDWIYDDQVSEKIIERDGKTYHRDPDVFDTWFSSSSWPYATLKYPDSQDFKDFYPLSLMETGGEILYPWVSRMLMLGLYMAKDIPFKEVYIHGYVMAEDGSKMSKSIGNVIDPLPVIEQYGSDALRMGIIAGRSPAVNRGYDPRKVEDARNFCNKLWNIARYVEGKLDGHTPGKPTPTSLADHWTLQNMNYCLDSVTSALENYRFAEAYDTLYHFVWDDVADWYIEASKIEENLDMMSYVLQTCLKMLHPFAPFVTETIWQTLQPDEDLLAIMPWPKQMKADKEKAKTFEDVRVIVSEIRFIKNQLKIQQVGLFHKEEAFIEENAELIKKFARLQAVESVSDGHGLNLTETPFDAWLNIDHSAIEQFVGSLKDKQAEHQASIKQLEGRLGNKSYVKNAPRKIVDQTKTQLEEAKAMLDKVASEINRFKD